MDIPILRTHSSPLFGFLKKIEKTCFFSSVLFLTFGSCQAGNAGAFSGKSTVSYLEGSAFKIPVTGQTLLPLHLGQEVTEGETITTSPNSRIEIQLDEKNTVRLNSDTSLVVIQLPDKDTPGKENTQINLTEGDIWTQLASLESGETFLVETPTTSSSIRGTVFRVSVQGDGTSHIKVYEGKVEVRPVAPKDLPQEKPPPRQIEGPHEIPGLRQIEGPKEITMEAWVCLIGAMQSITIHPGQKSPMVETFNLNSAEETVAWVQWNMKRWK